MPDKKSMGGIEAIRVDERFLIYITLDKVPELLDRLRFVAPHVTLTITWGQLVRYAEEITK